MEKIPVSGLISPIYPTDTYPIIDPRFGIDGLRSLDTLSDMYNLPLEKRRSGMVIAIPVTVSNTVDYYKLKPEGNGLTWSLGDTTNWDSFLVASTGSSTPIKNLITNEIITVPTNHQYLIWGDMTVGLSGSFVNDGEVYVINGNIFTASNGVTSGGGNYNFVSVVSKFSGTYSLGTAGVTVSHGLNTEDVVYSIKDSGNFIYANVSIIDSNNIFIISDDPVSNSRVTVIG
jgi:hypothetical protein